eukprot:m.195495 g.195495  ORF g.195495 m.195495 type:complete len:290 (-) comp19502_c0_seq1:85-954(-)
MARRVAVTSGGPRQRCLMRGCSKWEFAKGLCKECSAADPTGAISAMLSRDWEAVRNNPPIATNMVVTRVCTEPYMLELNEGDYVHVIEHMPERNLVVVRTATEKIGYYAADALKTEDQIYHEFTVDEDVSLILELEGREEKERQREAEFEASLRDRMKQKAEEERKARVEAERQAKARAQQMLEELEAKKAWEDQEARKAAAERSERAKLDAEQRRWRDEQLRKQAHAMREADERSQEMRLYQKAREHEAFMAAEEARKDKEYLDSLPAWKRAVVLKKREQDKAAAARR